MEENAEKSLVTMAIGFISAIIVSNFYSHEAARIHSCAERAGEGLLGYLVNGEKMKSYRELLKMAVVEHCRA
jgi:hypothetical protein